METPSRPGGAGTGGTGPARGFRLAGEQLAALSNAIVGLHRRYYGRGATKARAFQVHDDLIVVELRDVYLTVERTLIDRGQVNTVRQTRLTFQQAMFHEFLTAVEAVTGRKVSSYVSESVTSPEAVLEIFYLEPGSEVNGRLEREALEDAGRLERPDGGIPEPDPTVDVVHGGSGAEVRRASVNDALLSDVGAWNGHRCARARQVRWPLDGYFSRYVRASVDAQPAGSQAVRPVGRGDDS